MKNYRIEIKNDVLCISKRIKKIDRNYKIFFNQNSGNFEVWHKKELSLVLGKTLDNLALLKTHKTNIRNSKTLLQNMEETNEKLKMNENDDLENKNKALLSSLLSYLDKKSCETDFKDINTTKWF
ncbi:MAG: hypothetical protein EOM55_01285 [Clostridia bacterium]|nr:hypothetical protein [Clostridia bacterium]